MDILEILEAEKPAPVEHGTEEEYKAVYGHGVGELTGEKPRYYPHRWEMSPGPAIAQMTPEEEKFAGQKPPNAYIQSENAAHRLMLILKSRGHTNREIAELLGYAEPSVSQVMRQPWAVKRIIELQREIGIDPIKEQITELGKKALHTLDHILDSDAPANVKSNTAQYLVNRFLGKPKESLIISDNRNPDQLSDAELFAIAQAKN